MVEAAEPIYRADHLQLNVGKTHWVEASAVPVKQQKGWRTTKHLGSLLGSAEDVANRIRQAEVVFGQTPWRWYSMDTRIQLFRVLVMSVLMYNAGLWTMTSSLEKKLDGWQRRKMRSVGGYFWPHKIRSDKLHKQFGIEPASSLCRRMRLSWFGHVIREGMGSASYEALRMAIDISDVGKRRRGRPQTRWVDTVKKDLQKIGMSLDQAAAAAVDKRAWNSTCARCLESWA